MAKQTVIIEEGEGPRQTALMMLPVLDIVFKYILFFISIAVKQMKINMFLSVFCMTVAIINDPSPVWNRYDVYVSFLPTASFYK